MKQQSKKLNKKTYKQLHKQVSDYLDKQTTWTDKEITQFMNQAWDQMEKQFKKRFAKSSKKTARKRQLSSAVSQGLTQSLLAQREILESHRLIYKPTTETSKETNEKKRFPIYLILLTIYLLLMVFIWQVASTLGCRANIVGILK